MSAPSCARSSGSWPGTCAPSTIESTPASRAAAQISSTGRTSAVGEVMWLTETAFVRGPIASASSLRLGVDELHTDELPGPVHGAVLVARRQHLVAALELNDRMTAFRPAVAFGTKTRSSVWAPTNAGQRRPCLGGQLVEAAREELDRVALELALQLLVALEHRRRARPVAAVVQERDVRVEQKLQGVTVPW